MFPSCLEILQPLRLRLVEGLAVSLQLGRMPSVSPSSPTHPPKAKDTAFLLPGGVSLWRLLAFICLCPRPYLVARHRHGRSHLSVSPVPAEPACASHPRINKLESCLTRTPHTLC